MKKAWCILLALLIAIFSAACSAQNGTENQNIPSKPQTAQEVFKEYGVQSAKPNPEDTFAATYQITRIETAEGEVSADEATMQDIRDRGYRTVLVLQEDGTGVMELRGELSRFVYDDESGIITMNGQESQMILSEDGSLVIRDAAGTMFLELMP